jgi:hypothetical protein
MGNFIMSTKRIAFLVMAAGAVLASLSVARAADLPAKAPAAATINFTYPTLNGIIVEVFTEGGGSSVVASVPGVPPASLSTTTAGVGGTVGYMFTPKSSPISFSVEGHIEAQNFNGNNAGLSVQGPLRLEGAVIAWAPWARVFAALPTLWNPFASLSTFTLPAGFTAQGNALAGLGLYYSAADISTAFQGLQAGKVWRGNPGLEAITAQPLAGGGAIRIFAKWDFLGNSKIFGAVPASSIATVSTLGSNGVRAGVGYAF